MWNPWTLKSTSVLFKAVLTHNQSQTLQGSYIFRTRPVTPTQLPRQRQYLQDLLEQAQDHQRHQALDWQTENLMDRMGQMELADEWVSEWVSEWARGIERKRRRKRQRIRLHFTKVNKSKSKTDHYGLRERARGKCAGKGCVWSVCVRAWAHVHVYLCVTESRELGTDLYSFQQWQTHRN